jgi:hypothetical protein
MRHSATILAFGLSTTLLPAMAGNDRLLSYNYVTQENCVWAPGFTPDYIALLFRIACPDLRSTCRRTPSIFSPSRT